MCSTDVPIAKASPVDDSESSRLYVFWKADPTSLVVYFVICMPIDRPQMPQEPLDLLVFQSVQNCCSNCKTTPADDLESSRLYVFCKADPTALVAYFAVGIPIERPQMSQEL